MTLLKTFFGNKKTNDWALDMCPSVFFSKISRQKMMSQTQKLQKIKVENGKFLQFFFIYCYIIFDAFEFTFTAYNKRKGLNVEKRGEHNKDACNLQ